MPRPLIPDRRARILDATEALVLERGFDAMSVQSIAGRVGIAKGAVYREFTSKNEILDELLRRAMTRMTRKSEALLGGQGRPPLSRAYAVGARVLLDDRLMTAAFLDDRGVLGAYLDAVDDDRYRRRHRDVVAWIETLQRRGSLSRAVDAEALALVLSSTTIGLLQAARHVGPVTEDDLHAAIETIGGLLRPLERADDDG
ncbi:TetR/AcrR family transcriptional regulator [Microbacterium betulae]|uniref:TetR/AcrR family transcriptional regulator n=1 Tax=Microbacterium betulae TaxID=2981139 RepID=A0AA97I5F4_9MICO|nr:TetR/AcrR family transcriptional regulator [Microbacterium sp. AB]WOF23671.1 TetR/AcrR family transcriptional regulator [Microbacterium sp. AB]